MALGGRKQLEFTLRQGVKFHDGSAFSADDVVYTLNLASNPESRVATPSNFSWIANAEKIDDFKVRVNLKQPTPAALEYFALVMPIYPSAYRQRVGPEGYTKAPVGSGPYRVTRFEPGAAIEYERFEGYWEGSPKGRPAIRKLSVRFVPDATTEMTELLSGRADWVWNVNPDQFDNINRLPTVQAVRQESMRVGYLSIDAAGRSAAGNPLTNLKVRQAIWHAIDRETIAKQAGHRRSRVLRGALLPSAIRLRCRGRGALRLRSGQGARRCWPRPVSRTASTSSWSAMCCRNGGVAVQNYLQAVGIKARMNQMQVAAAIQRSLAGPDPLFLGSWGSYSINDVSAIMPVFSAAGGGLCPRRGDAEADAEGGSTIDPEARKKAYSAAIRRVTEKAFWLPLHTYVTIYGFSRQLNFKPYADELPRFYLAKLEIGRWD